MGNARVQRRRPIALAVAGLSHHVRSLRAREHTLSRHLTSAAATAAAPRWDDGA
jgi:hypothetical protein